MDFYRIVMTEKKDGTLEVRPDWIVGRSKDLMTRGGSFYAVWDEEKGLWSTDIYDVQRLVDADLRQWVKDKGENAHLFKLSTLESNGTRLWEEFNRFLRNSGNNFHTLDSSLIFSNTEVKKEDYASRRLDYSLVEGPHDAWDTLIGTLYNEEERAKIEWAIGAVISGDSKTIQKFLVFYGPPGSGKSTMLNIIQKLFEGYCAIFDARELASSNNTFATAAFKGNPLVAIQHDGDLSRIYDNTKLNSIVAHETMTVNEKYKTPFETRSNAFLFMGTNVPVKISDAKSGIIRRLIDVVPTQKTFENERYNALIHQVQFELGAIAKHCLDRYKSMGKNFYGSYRPTEMMLQTDVFYNYVEAHYDVFRHSDGISLKQAWALYKEYCSETGIDKMLPQYKFREELKNYFDGFEERIRIDGQNVRSWYHGFRYLALYPTSEFPIKTEGFYTINLEEQIPSVLDGILAGMPAQYADENGGPEQAWSKVTTTLSDIDTTRLHWVKVPENHIVVDFDLANDAGEKDFVKNLEEASKWPATYAEISQSGLGLHLHYIYMGGDVKELASIFGPGIEIKTLLGNGSLRRKLTKSNGMNITPLHTGLPKKEKPLISTQHVQSERSLRKQIDDNLQKKIHAGTKPSIDFIKKILDDAYNDNLSYDVSDMRKAITTFAARSTHQAPYCLKLVNQMKFVGKQPMPETVDVGDDEPLVFFDVEVYPNLFVVCWKRQGSDTVIRMINPEPKDIEPLLKMKLVGFNNRRYDNHILYARYLNRSLEELFKQSWDIANSNKRDCYFPEAYNLSYADIYDFSSKKQGLKKFMIELKIKHMELDLPYDKPVPQELWKLVEEYCVNDVIGTEATFEDRRQDFVARQILSELSGLSVNHTTQAHTAKIIFGDDKEPQRQFVYTDLSKEFPGYVYDRGESTYRSEVTGEGGYVYAEPGIYENVALLDVASMHPTSIEVLNLFGPYTERYSALKEARMAIKRKEYDRAKLLLDGKLEKFLGDAEDADALAYALKIVINIVYGLTSARFPNAFRDDRNIDNIVAKRGALFMIDLKHAVQEMGFQVVHIKTDSIKIPNATPELIADVIDFGKKYGYDFEHETTYDWFCLVNDAVYVARKNYQDHEEWTTVGAQFQHPYIRKSLFTKEPIELDDFFETKNVVKGTMYLDFVGDTENPADMVHIGSTGSFIPVKDNGAVLWRIKEDKRYAVTGTKDHRWITREMAMQRAAKDELNIDFDYFEKLKKEAVSAIAKFDGQKYGLDEYESMYFNGMDPELVST